MLRSLMLMPLCLLALTTTTGGLLAGPGQGSPIQFDFWGFSMAPDPEKPGHTLEIVAVLNENTTQVPLDLDFGANEYTVHIHGLRLRRVVQNGPFRELHFRHGTLDIYCDPSFNAPFRATTDPLDVPDLDPTQVPANFKDGTLLVRYRFDRYVALFWEQQGIGTIAYAATELHVSRGSARKRLDQAGLSTGWHMGGGYTDDAAAHIPLGYGMRYDTLVRWESGRLAQGVSPLATESSTWGAIKSIFR